MSNCRKAYYSLQRAGMCSNGLGLETCLHLFSVTCKNILLYGCNALHISRHNIIELDKLQAKLIKNILGILASHRSTLLLKALNIQYFVIKSPEYSKDIRYCRLQYSFII